MENNDKDIRKEIEDLEKLIEEVKQSQQESKKPQKREGRPKGTIQINLAERYAGSLPLHLLISFLSNFVLIFFINSIFRFANVQVEYVYLLIALFFTFFEEIHKRYLLKHQIQLVLFSSGLIFFLLNLMFIYFLDLVVFVDSFSFVNNIYPIFFLIAFQIARVLFKALYMTTQKAIGNTIKRISKRK